MNMFRVGDHVWVESSGQLVFPLPVAITKLVEHHDGTRWAFVEGSSSAVCVDALTSARPGGLGSADARNGIEDGPLVRFTAFVSNRRLSKHYKRKPDGDLETLSGTQFSSGGYYVCEIPAAGEGSASRCAGPSLGSRSDSLRAIHPLPQREREVSAMRR